MELDRAKQHLLNKPDMRPLNPSDDLAFMAHEGFQLVIYQPGPQNSRYVSFGRGPKEEDAIVFPLFSHKHIYDPQQKFDNVLEQIIISLKIDSPTWMDDEVLTVPRTIAGIDLGYQTIVKFNQFLESVLVK